MSRKDLRTVAPNDVDFDIADLEQRLIPTLRATGVIVPVGYDGDAYVEDLSPHNKITVETPNGRHCTVIFDYQPLPGEIPSIGPLRCMEPRQ